METLPRPTGIHHSLGYLGSLSYLIRFVVAIFGMASERADTQEPRARQSTFPLNSKCLTVAYVTQLAAALQLLTKASATDLLQIIEGKLREMEHEPAKCSSCGQGSRCG